MRHIIDRDKLSRIYENFNISSGTIIWVHHPITEDLIKVSVVKSQKDKVLVSVLENSPYAGQPDWWIKKLHIIGVNN
jgi:hypothetical protein